MCCCYVATITSCPATPCVCSLQKLLHQAEEEKSELSLHITAQEKQFKGEWGVCGVVCVCVGMGVGGVGWGGVGVGMGM